MKRKPAISIIVRAYNEEKHLPELLNRLKQQTLQNYEFILVDSGSTDSTVTIAKNNGAKIVSISKKDFSFGRALNIGCEAASADIFLFASAHVHPERQDWLQIILSEFRDKKVGLVYGRQRAGATNKFSERILLKSWFPDKIEKYQKSAFCNNANCAIRRKLWLKNKYDENLTGLEDIAWAKAIKRQNWEIVYNCNASIIHIHEESWRQVYRRYYREAIALSVIDPGSRMSFFDFIWLFYQNSFSDFRHAIFAGLFLTHALEILTFRFLQFFGSWKGLNNPLTMNQDLIKRLYYPSKDG